MSLKQEEYNQMAIKWVENYLSNNPPKENFKSFDEIFIINSHYSLDIWLQRLKNSKGREQEASFLKIKKYKDWTLKENQNETI